MREIKSSGRLLAVFFNPQEMPKGLSWIGDQGQYLQCGVWNYDSTKRLNEHAHKRNPRIVWKTQEAVVVLKGRILAKMYNEEKAEVARHILSAGEIGIFYEGGHGFEVLTDGTLAVEFKPGPFNSVGEDKEVFA